MGEVPLYYQHGRRVCTPADDVSEQDLVERHDGSRSISNTRIRSRQARNPTVGSDASQKILILGVGAWCGFHQSMKALASPSGEKDLKLI